MSTNPAVPAYQPPANGFRTFLTVWITQSISVVGTTMTYFATVIWLTQTLYAGPSQQGQLALAITTLSLAFAIPAIFLGPIAGAYADRHDRRRIMIVADSLSGLTSLLLAALLVTGTLRLWSLLAIGAAAAILGAFHNSAFDASYFMLVPRAQLPRANGMMQTTWALAGILAPAAAASLIALPGLARSGRLGGSLGAALAGLESGASLAIAVDAVTFFLAAATLLFLYIPSPKRDDLEVGGARRAGAANGAAAKSGAGTPAPGRPRPKSIWADVREGVVYIARRRPLLWLLLTFAMVNLCTAPFGVLQPLLAKFRLAADYTARGFSYESALALLSSVTALGGVAGGVLVSTWGGLKQRRVWGVLVPLVPVGVALAVFGLSTSLYLTAAMGFIVAAGGPIANAHSQAIWQTQTPPELQGRVFSVRRLIAQFTAPIGTALGGALAGLVGATAVIAVGGLLEALFCLAQVLNPHMLRVEDRDYLESLAAAAEKRAETAGAAAPAGEEAATGAR